MEVASLPAAQCADGFRHEALLYSGDEEFLAATVDFIQAGIERGEPVLVVVSAEKIGALRSELGPDASAVQFADMAGIGRNPARIIPAWREFVDWGPAAGRTRRGVGEPIWQGRSEIELIECQRHEALLNIAFGGGTPWWLLCPYDTVALDEATVTEASRSHPLLLIDGVHREGLMGTHEELATAHLDAPLPELPGLSADLVYGSQDLRDVREYVAAHAIASGLSAVKAFDLLVAVSEVATNSVRHGGGSGALRVWHDHESVVCEFSDCGKVTDPLAGRRIPDVDAEGERGLWLANQLCDLVQLRVYDFGTVIRLHMRVGRGSSARR